MAGVGVDRGRHAWIWRAAQRAGMLAGARGGDWARGLPRLGAMFIAFGAEVDCEAGHENDGDEMAKMFVDVFKCFCSPKRHHEPDDVYSEDHSEVGSSIIPKSFD